MSKIYVVKQFIMNGSVTLREYTTAFTSKELAELAKKKLDEINEKRAREDTKLGGKIPSFTRLEEIDLYSIAAEVPILNADREFAQPNYD